MNTDAGPKIFGKKNLAFIIIIIIIIIIIRVILNWTGLNLNIVVVIYHLCGLCSLVFYVGQLRHFSVE